MQASLIEILKKHSDVFCPMMLRAFPMAPEKHLQMCLETLNDLGVEFEGDLIEVDIEAGISEEQQLAKHINRLAENGVNWSINRERAPHYVH